MNEKYLLQRKIEDSEGIKCINRMKYHNTSISIFVKNFSELSKTLLHFEDIKNCLKIMDQNNQEAGEKFFNEITRLLHNFLASAKTLIEHTRIFMNKCYKNTINYKKYAAEVEKEFANDELCRFIQDLRNYMLHRGLPYTGMSLSQTFEIKIHLDRDSMLEWTKWTTLSRNYLLSQPKDIRIYDFVRPYAEKVNVFNIWLNSLLKKYGSAKDVVVN